MDLLQLHYFLYAVKHKSFTNAAKILYTSQSNISKQVSKLKSELGVELFERKNSKVIPTAAGTCLYEGLLKLKPEFDKLIEETKKIGKENQNILRIAICDNMDFDKILAGAVDKIMQSEPELQMHIETFFIDEILQKLVLKELDVAIIFSIMETKLTEITRYPLNRANNLIYFSKKHPLYKKKNLTLMDFKNETFYRLDIFSRKKDYNPYSCLPFIPKKTVKAKSLTALFLNVESNLGVTILGQNQIFPNKDRIATFEVNAPEHMVGCDAIWLSDNNTTALKSFLKYLYIEYPT